MLSVTPRTDTVHTVVMGHPGASNLHIKHTYYLSKSHMDKKMKFEKVFQTIYLKMKEFIYVIE